MKNLLLILAFLSVVVLGSGCTSPNPPAQTEPPQFVWLDDTTPQSVKCTGAQMSHTADGRLTVIAHLRNQEIFRVEVQVNCVFMDANGFTVDEAPFRTLIIDENATQDVAFEAFKPNAVKYLIRARKTR